MGRYLTLDSIKKRGKLLNTIMKIPSNYRQLKPDEIIRKGDLYQSVFDKLIVAPVRHSIGNKASSRPDYTFWRRRHTKATPLSRVAAASTSAQPTANKKNVTIVEFTYNWKARRVQLISLDAKYLTGLEITREGSRYNYQFKKYLRYKVDNGLISLYHFGEPLTNH